MCRAWMLSEQFAQVLCVNHLSESVEHWLVRNRFIELDATPLTQDAATPGPLFDRPVGQPGFPDSNVSKQQNAPPVTCYRRIH
jgi:hypothetical protein